MRVWGGGGGQGSDDGGVWGWICGCVNAVLYGGH